MLTLVTKLKVYRWYHWLAAALVLLYIVYIGLSYLYLPGKLKQLVEEDVSALIGRDISVEKFEYNPFALSLRVRQLSLAGDGEGPLVAWHQLFVDVAFWKSLVFMDVALSELMLDQPQVHVVKRGDRFNFTGILEQLAAGAESTPQAPSPSSEDTSESGIALEIAETSIHDGVFRFDDLGGAAPARSSLHDINIAVHDLYLATGDEHLNPFDVEANFPDGGNLLVGGQYRLDPLHIETRLQAQDIQLATFKDFVKNIIPMNLNNGLLSADADILVTHNKAGVDVDVSNGRLSVDELALDDEVLDPPMIRVSTVDLAGITFNLLQKKASVASFKLNGAEITQWLDKQGRPRYEYVLTKALAEENIEEYQEQVAGEEPNKSQASEWDWVIEDFLLDQSNMYFIDQVTAEDTVHSIKDINIALQNISLSSDQNVSAQISTLINEQGKLTVQGDIVLLPFSMSLDYKLEQLPLATLSSYSEAYSYLRIEAGYFNSAGNVNFRTDEQLPLQVTADAGINNFIADDTRTGKPIAEFDAFVVGGIALDTQSHKISIGQVTLQRPQLGLEVSPEGSLNFATLVKPVETKTNPGTEETEAQQQQPPVNWQFAIGAVALEDGTTLFTDRTVTPVFKTGIYTMEFSLDEVSTERKTDTPFTFSSKIDRYAPLTIEGTLAPVAQQPGLAFNTQLSGLDMPALSPYSGTFIGNTLKSGKLNLNLDYTLRDRKLRGNNHVRATDLYLGEDVDSERATDAPVALGLALLRDLDGVIKMDVGVSGELDDPGFSVSGVIAKAFLNVLVKAVASPFSLLGSLAGGGEEMGSVDFAAGFSQLDNNNRQQLATLVEALNKRPELVLSIVGSASMQDDQRVLQQLKVQEVVASARKMSLQDLRAEAGEQDWWTVRANRRLISTLNSDLNLTALGERRTQLLSTQPELSGDALEAALYQAVYNDVALRQPVGEQDILALADQRAVAIKQYLVDELGFDHQRIAVGKAGKKQLQGRIVKLGLTTKGG